MAIRLALICFLITCCWLIRPTHAEAIIEPDAVICDFEDPTKVVAELVVLVRKNGWRCDTVSFACIGLFTPKFTLKCNENRYKYEVMDRAGRFVACIDKCKF